jgi:hypothetical protein
VAATLWNQDIIKNIKIGQINNKKIIIINKKIKKNMKKQNHQTISEYEVELCSIN